MILLASIITRPFRAAPAALALGLAMGFTGLSSAQHGGITVTVTGEAEVRPDTLVFEGTLTESAESPEDAVVAFRDTRRRAVQSIESLDIEGLSVEASGLRISRGGDMAGGMGGMVIGPGGGDIDVPPGQLAISQTVTIQIAGIDALEQEDLIDLIVEVGDAAQEAGISIGAMTEEDMMMMQFGQGMGSSDLALFSVTDAGEAQNTATERAMAKAREQAQRLAALAGVELGGVTAIVEGPVADDGSSQNGYLALIWGMASEQTDALSSATHDPITVSTTLTVTFAIE